MRVKKNQTRCSKDTDIENWMASIAVDAGKKSLTATSLFSFFLSNQIC